MGHFPGYGALQLLISEELSNGAPDGFDQTMGRVGYAPSGFTVRVRTSGMSVGSDSDRGEMTLAFSLSAIKRFEDPAAVFGDAQKWSQHVGVIDNDVDAIEMIVEEQDLQQDFDLGDRDKWLAMEGIREVTHTPRHVYVGASAEDRRVADHVSWEFVPVTEAAEKADWTLTGEELDNGVLTRLRQVVPDWLRLLRSN